MTRPRFTPDCIQKWPGWRFDPGLPRRSADATDQERHALLGLGVRAIAKELARIGEDAGVRPLNPDRIPHAAISAALDAGHSMTHVRAFSRHRRLETLLAYDDHRTRGAAQLAAGLAATL
jgi:hypothetical protein